MIFRTHFFFGAVSSDCVMRFTDTVSTATALLISMYGVSDCPGSENRGIIRSDLRINRGKSDYKLITNLMH